MELTPVKTGTGQAQKRNRPWTSLARSPTGASIVRPLPNSAACRTANCTTSASAATTFVALPAPPSATDFLKPARVLTEPKERPSPGAFFVLCSCHNFARRCSTKHQSAFFVQHHAHLHGSRRFFALHALVVCMYKVLIRRCTRHTALKLLRKTMNPIRIAKNWISYRRTMNELGNLSNQALTDIGLTRYDIRNVAARSYR